jgi:hypothetical protein
MPQSRLNSGPRTERARHRMIAIYCINTLIVAIAVLVHYEMLSRLTVLIPRLMSRHRLRVLVALCGSLLAHVIEVWIFALGFYALLGMDGFGRIDGAFDGSLLDCVYFSFTTYTTLGIGDIQPLGDLRFLAGLESLTGFLLITWTASFMFVEMSRNWKQ